MLFLSLISQVRLTPTAARRSRRAGWRLAAVKTECTSAPSPCPAPTSGMKPSTPARAAAHVRTSPRNQNPGKDLNPKFSHSRRPHFHNEALAIAVTSGTSAARWRRYREKEESRLTCGCVARYNLSEYILQACLHTPTPLSCLYLPSCPPIPTPSSVFLSFLPKRKMNAFWGHHSSPVISLSLWLAVKKHLNAHQQNNSHFHACLHSGSSH